MARRDDGDLALLLEQLVRAPWWISVVLAVAVYIGVSNVLPSVVDGPVFGSIAEVVSGLAWMFAGLFVLPAAPGPISEVEAATSESRRMVPRQGGSVGTDRSWQGRHRRPVVEQPRARSSPKLTQRQTDAD